jgi:hypothetical protein
MPGKVTGYLQIGENCIISEAIRAKLLNDVSSNWLAPGSEYEICLTLGLSSNEAEVGFNLKLIISSSNYPHIKYLQLYT